MTITVQQLNAAIANAKTCAADDTFTLERDHAIALWRLAIKGLQAAEIERDAEATARDVAAEVRWQERQGEEYGSY